MADGNGKPPNPAVEAAIDRVKQQAVPEVVELSFPVASRAHKIPAGRNLQLRPKEHPEPTILVWISELGYYQPVFLPPGGVWLLQEAAPPPTAPKLYVPK